MPLTEVEAEAIQKDIAAHVGLELARANDANRVALRKIAEMHHARVSPAGKNFLVLPADASAKESEEAISRALAESVPPRTGAGSWETCDDPLCSFIQQRAGIEREGAEVTMVVAERASLDTMLHEIDSLQRGHNDMNSRAAALRFALETIASLKDAQPPTDDHGNPLVGMMPKAEDIAIDALAREESLGKSILGIVFGGRALARAVRDYRVAEMRSNEAKLDITLRQQAIAAHAVVRKAESQFFLALNLLERGG